MGLSSKWDSFKKLLKPTDKSDFQAKIAASLKESGETLEKVNESISALKSAFKESCEAENVADMFSSGEGEIVDKINDLQKNYKEVRSKLSDGVVDLVGKTGRSESKKCADAFIQTLSGLEETFGDFREQKLAAGEDNSDVLVSPWQNALKEIVKLNSAVEKVSDKKAALGGKAKVEAKALTKALQSQVEDLKDIFVSVNGAVAASKAAMGTIEGDASTGGIGASDKLNIFSPGSEKLLAKSVKSLAPVQLETEINSYLEELKTVVAGKANVIEVANKVKDLPLQILHSVRKLLKAILESGQLSLLSESHLKNYVKKLGDVLAMQHAILLKIAKAGDAESCGSMLAKLEKLNIELNKLNAKLGSKVKSSKGAKLIVRLDDKSNKLLSKVISLSSSKPDSKQPKYEHENTSYEIEAIAQARGGSFEENNKAQPSRQEDNILAGESDPKQKKKMKTNTEDDGTFSYNYSSDPVAMEKRGIITSKVLDMKRQQLRKLTPEQLEKPKKPYQGHGYSPEQLQEALRDLRNKNSVVPTSKAKQSRQSPSDNDTENSEIELESLSDNDQPLGASVQKPSLPDLSGSVVDTSSTASLPVSDSDLNDLFTTKLDGGSSAGSDLNVSVNGDSGRGKSPDPPHSGSAPKPKPSSKGKKTGRNNHDDDDHKDKEENGSKKAKKRLSSESSEEKLNRQPKDDDSKPQVDLSQSKKEMNPPADPPLKPGTQNPSDPNTPGGPTEASKPTQAQEIENRRNQLIQIMESQEFKGISTGASAMFVYYAFGFRPNVDAPNGLGPYSASSAIKSMEDLLLEGQPDVLKNLLEDAVKISNILNTIENDGLYAIRTLFNELAVLRGENKIPLKSDQHNKVLVSHMYKYEEPNINKMNALYKACVDTSGATKFKPGYGGIMSAIRALAAHPLTRERYQIIGQGLGEDSALYWYYVYDASERKWVKG